MHRESGRVAPPCGQSPSKWHKGIEFGRNREPRTSSMHGAGSEPSCDLVLCEEEDSRCSCALDGDFRIRCFFAIGGLSAAKPGSTAPPHAAPPVGRLAIRRDERLTDGRGGLPSRRRAFAGRADPGYVNSGLTAEGRWADRNGPQKGAHAARCAGSGMSDAVGCRIGEAKGSE